MQNLKIIKSKGNQLKQRGSKKKWRGSKAKIKNSEKMGGGAKKK